MLLWVYWEIFPHVVWGIMFSICVLTAVAFASIRVAGVENLHSPQDSETFGVVNGLGLIGLMFLQLEYQIRYTYRKCKSTPLTINCPFSKDRLSTRVLFLFTAGITYLLFAYYNCDLTSRMTSSVPLPPIRSFADVIAQEYKVVAVANSSAPELLRT